MLSASLANMYLWKLDLLKHLQNFLQSPIKE